MDIGILGMGRAGMNFAKLLKAEGHVISMWDICISGLAQELAERNHYTIKPPKDLLKSVDWLLICVPDDFIEEAVQGIEDFSYIKGIAHVSGVTSLAVFQSVPKKIKKMCLHPIRAFATLDDDIALFKKTHFGFEGEEAVYIEWKHHLASLSKHIHNINSEDKIAYHLAAVEASNFIMPLLHSAVKGYCHIGIDASVAVEITTSLVQTALDNFKEKGAIEGLTGPVARGDIKTIKKHLSILDNDAKKDYLGRLKQTYMLVENKHPKQLRMQFEAILREETI